MPTMEDMRRMMLYSSLMGAGGRMMSASEGAPGQPAPGLFGVLGQGAQGFAQGMGQYAQTMPLMMKMQQEQQRRQQYENYLGTLDPARQAQYRAMGPEFVAKDILQRTKPQTTPPGYQRTATGSLAPIPGGPADPAQAGRLAEARNPFYFQQVQDPSGAIQTIAIPRSQVGKAGGVVGRRERIRKPEEAGRTTMIGQAMTDATFVRRSILGELTAPKEIDQALVASMYFNIPRTDGRRLRSRMENALSTKLRLETGAQANQQELDNMMQRFLPSPFDNKETITDKLTRLEEFMGQSLQLTAPDLYEQMRSRATRGKARPTSKQAPKGKSPPPGAVLYGHKDGKEIYRLPNGKYWSAD